MSPAAPFRKSSVLQCLVILPLNALLLLVAAPIPFSTARAEEPPSSVSNPKKEAQAPAVTPADLNVSFRGRWTATGGAFVSIGSDRFSYGGELGARRWANRFFLTSLLAQYEKFSVNAVSPQPLLTDKYHGVNLIARAEFTIPDREYLKHYYLRWPCFTC